METNGIATEWFERIEEANERHAEHMRKIAKRIHTANENYARTLSEYARLSEEYQRHPKVIDTGGGLPGEIHPL